MARAKRTERAEARRRYRAATAEPEGRRCEAADADRTAGPAKARLGAKTGDVRARPAAIGDRGRLPPSFHPFDIRRGPRGPAVARHQHARSGCRCAHGRQRAIARAVDRRPTLVTASCSRTSSSRRPSAACSSPASWRRGRAGCSALIVGLVSAVCYAVLVPVAAAGDPRPCRTQSQRRTSSSRRSCCRRLRRVVRRRAPPGTAASCALEPEPRKQPQAQKREDGKARRRPDATATAAAEGAAVKR